MRTDFKRRFLLQSLSGALLAPLLADARPAPATLSDALRLLGDAGPLPHRMSYLARCFRALPAHAGQRNQLLAQLRASPQANTAQGVAEVFARQRRDDFRANHVLIIDGWVLARAEAELCELLSA